MLRRGMLLAPPVFLLLLALTPAFSGTISPALVINFDQFSDGDILTDQIPGMRFTNTQILGAGQGLNEFEAPPYSLPNVAGNIGNGPITVQFSMPVYSVYMYVTYGAPLTFDSFDAAGTLLGSDHSQFSSNLALSGDPGSSPNEWVGLSSVTQIDRIEILASGQVAIDNMSISTPEPGSGPMIIGALLVLIGRLHWRTRQESRRCATRCGRRLAWNRQATRAVLVGLLAIVAHGTLLAAQAVDQLVATPSVFAVNTLTQVTVSALINDPTVIPGGVNLLRIDSTGKAVIIGILQDNGAGGDQVAGDHVYTLQIPFHEVATGQIVLKASVAFKGLLQRVQSAPLTLRVSAQPPVATFQAYVDSTDSHLFRATTTQGLIVDYYGQRDTNGHVSALTAFQVIPKGGSTTTYLLDQLGRPVRVTAPNGVVFNLAWQSSTSLVLTAIDPSGSVQVSVPVPATTVTGAGTNALRAAVLKESVSKTAVSVSPLDVTANALVNVRQCGNPVDDADVSLSIVSHTTGALPSVPGIPLGNGMYSVPIPVYQSNAVSNAVAHLQDFCLAAADVLGDVCTSSEVLKSSEPFLPGLVGIVVASIPGGAPLVPLFVTATASLLEGLDIYCSTLGDGITGGPDLAEFLCDNVTELVDSGSQAKDFLDLTASATLPGNDTPLSTTVFNISSAGPFPNLFINFSCPTRILTVTKTGSGSVSSTDGAIQCGTTCSAGYPQGSQVVLTASPAASFQSWEGSCSGTAATTSLTIYSNATCTAQFGTAVLTLVPLGPGSGTISSVPGGIICGGTCSGSFPLNTPLTLTALPASGSSFLGWGGSCSGSGLNTTLTLNKDLICTATFGGASRTLTVNSGGFGSGRITSSPVGIDCANCSALFAESAKVTLTATPSQTSTFSGWGGDCSGSINVTSIVLSANLTCTANFGALTNSLTATLVGNGFGSITSSPPGINCTSGSCSAPFTPGSPVILIAVPANNSNFAGWSGNCTGSSASTTVTMLGDKTCVATFSLVSEGLTVTKNGTGSGTVTSSPAGISCGVTCSFAFAFGTTVILTPTPAGGSTFAGWSGDCNSSGIVTVSGNKGCTATFSVSSGTLTVTKSGTGSGTVTSSPSGISCGSTCSFPFAVGTTVALTPTPAGGSTFAGWSGDCNSSGSVTVSDTGKRCTATFNSRGTVTVIKGGNGSGDVISRPAGISCGAICSAPFAVGTFITLIPSPAAGSTFAGWSGDCLNETVFVTAAAKNCTTAFTLAPTYPLTVTISGDGYINSIYNPPLDTFVHDCHGTCTFNFPVGAKVSLSALPTHPDPTKRIWTGDCIPDFGIVNGSGASVVMNGPKTCTATFAGSATTGNLQVIDSGTGSDFGSISSSPAGITCGTLCSNGFSIGSTVTLTATGSQHASFVSFSGNCIVNDPVNHPNVCTISIQGGNNVVVATFSYVF